MWNLFSIFLIWRILRAVFGFFIYLVKLMLIAAISLYQQSNHQVLLAHRPRDAGMDNLLGWTILAVLGIFLIFVPAVSLKILFFLLAGGVLVSLVSGSFRPLGLFADSEIRFLDQREVHVF